MGSRIGMQSVEDLRILAEMADEIQKYGCPGLPGSLRSLIRTERGKNVGAVLEKLSRDLLILKYQYKEEVEKLRNKNDDLRDEMQLVTDRLEALESEGNSYRIKKS
jgi:FtsZ-binding cell division protein ZapB